MKEPTSRRERILAGIATVVILGIAFWLFVGRSPGGPKRVEVAFGDSVETDHRWEVAELAEAMKPLADLPYAKAPESPGG